jgi:hypothetical protein
MRVAQSASALSTDEKLDVDAAVSACHIVADRFQRFECEKNRETLFE